MAPDVKAWARKFESLTNSDETIQSMGKYYTCSFIYDMEQMRVLIEMNDGKVKRIEINPGPIEACDFVLKASAASWRERDGDRRSEHAAQPNPAALLPRAASL